VRVSQDITAPVAPDAATTASDVAAEPPVGEAGYATAGYGATTGAADTRSGMAMVGQQVLRLEVQRLCLCYDGIDWVLVLVHQLTTCRQEDLLRLAQAQAQPAQPSTSQRCVWPGWQRLHATKELAGAGHVPCYLSR
jgi:hypothetical protein